MQRETGAVLMAVLLVLASVPLVAFGDSSSESAETSDVTLQRMTVEELELADVTVEDATIQTMTVDTVEVRAKNRTLSNGTLRGIQLQRLSFENVSIADLQTDDQTLAEASSGNTSAEEVAVNDLTIEQMNVARLVVSRVRVEIADEGEQTTAGDARVAQEQETTPTGAEQVELDSATIQTVDVEEMSIQVLTLTNVTVDAGRETTTETGALQEGTTTETTTEAQNQTVFERVSVGNASVQRATAFAPTAEGTNVESGTVGFIGIQSLSAPSEVQQGEQYTVEATVVNVGNGRSVQQVSYRIQGNVVASELVQVSAGESETVTFEVSVGRFPAGEFTHGVYTQGSSRTALVNVTAGDQTDEGEINVGTTREAGETTTEAGETTTEAGETTTESP